MIVERLQAENKKIGKIPFLSMKHKHIVLALVLASPFCGGITAAEAQDRKSPSDYPVYKLSVGDSLSVRVVGSKGMEFTGVVIKPDGQISGIGLGSPIALAGLSVSDAQRLLEAEYRKQPSLQQSRCDLKIEKYAPRQVSVPKKD